jgi:hypothetical protein
MVSHPFFTFEYLIAMLRRLRPDLEFWVPRLRNQYCGPWRQLFSEEELSRDFAATPALAALAFAVGATDWHLNAEEIRPEMAKLMRALARRIHRELSRETFQPERR